MKKPTKLDMLRAHIGLIDTLIVSLIAKREKIVLKIEKIKRKNGEPIFIKELEDKRIGSAVETAQKLKMSKGSQEFIEKIFTAIITYCRNSEKNQRKNAGRK